MATNVLSTASGHWDLLTHSFYQRWTRGELTRNELKDYACQYAKVVQGLPRWLERAAAEHPLHSRELTAHAWEERSHVALWAEFASALGVDPEELREVPANTSTTALISRCDLLAGSGDGAAVAWALEVRTPAVSVKKLEGLRKYYGIEVENGGRYFHVHQGRDLAHAAELERVIEEDSDGLRAAAAADQVLEGLWGLLSSVERPVTSLA